jgi:glycosyltransferase involved in cell wall biosynthesis
MSKLLFYYPSNKASVQVETTLLELSKMGHEVVLLTTCKKGVLHKNLSNTPIATYTNVVMSTGAIYYLKQLIFLIQFVRKHEIEVVFGNLQHTNFIAVLAQYFFKARVIAFRHHFKFSKGNFGIPLKINKNEVLFDRIINLLAKEIIVPSQGVYDGMKKFERVNMDKVKIIPYLYDFSLYKKPNMDNVAAIKRMYPCKLRIIMVARLIPFKRHMLVLPIFHELIEEGMEIQVLILDEGPEKPKIEQYIFDNKLSDSIHLIGYTTDFIDFMKASDLLIHPSITEASNNVVKEIGLLAKAVAVCRGVGDFDSYLRDGENGYLLPIEQPQETIKNIIRNLYYQPTKIDELGNHLKQTIIKEFSDTSKVKSLYNNLLSQN